MDKASRLIRRSSVKLLALGGGHSDLNVLVSDVRDVRNSAKAFMNSQHITAQDMIRWAAHEENRAVQDVVTQIAELNLAWTEVQNTLTDNLKAYRQMFEMILDGEKQVAQAKSNLDYCSQKEMKARKELKRAAKKASSHELRLLESKISLTEKEREMAQVEVNNRVRENESVKLIRLKEGLLKMSGSFMEMSHKCNTLFTAQRDLALQLPDVHGRDLEYIKYTGSEKNKLIVQKAKDKVKAFTQSHTYNDEPPPPYTPPEQDSPVLQAANQQNILPDPGNSNSSVSPWRLAAGSGSSPNPPVRSDSKPKTPTNNREGACSTDDVQTRRSFTHTNVVHLLREDDTPDSSSSPVLMNQSHSTTDCVEQRETTEPPCVEQRETTEPPCVEQRETTEPPDYHQYIQDQASSAVHLNPPANCTSSDLDSSQSRPTPKPRQRRNVQEEEYDTAEEDCEEYLEEAVGGTDVT